MRYTELPEMTMVRVQIKGYDIGKNLAATPSMSGEDIWWITHKGTGAKIPKAYFRSPSAAATAILEIEKLGIEWDKLDPYDPEKNNEILGEKKRLMYEIIGKH